jgi:hypothetical protein
MNLPQHLDKCRRLVTIPAGDVQGDLAVVAAWQVSQPLHALETNADFGSEPTPLESNGIRGRISGPRLECRVSPKSLPVPVRRLMESDDESAESLASDICQTFDIELI